MFQLHPDLARDCIEISSLDLCRILLRDDRTYPWAILVPQREQITEIYQLSGADRILLVEECCQVGAALNHIYKPDKMNMAALGNQVPQLHVHQIARFRTDPAWPEPVWGKAPPQPYAPEERATAVNALRNALEKIDC
jgi:diadenosine tetraphosphate (Ap4A) HIT family hydrolase